MSEVKIGVKAGVEGVDQAIAKITQRMNALAQAVGKNQNLKVEPTDMKLMSRDLDLINKNFKQTIALSSQLRGALKATGQSGLNISQVDFSKLSTNPQVAQRLRDRAFLNSVRGTSLDPTLANEVDHNGNIVPPSAGGGAGASGGGAGGGSGGGSGGSGGGGGRRPPRGSGGASGGGEGAEGGSGSWWRRRPQGGWGTATALAVGNGIGGTAGNMITAGMGGGGLPGAGLAALTSLLGKGMEWAGQGMAQAKDRNVDLDTLKRQMGDLGISFSDLSAESYKAAQGLGIANTEFVKLEGQANAVSGGAYRTPAELAAATRSGADLGRAYGLDPSQGVGFVSGMQRMQTRQNNKELAVQLADAIVGAQGKAMPAEVKQAIQSFSAAQNRFNSGYTDLDRFGNAYGSLLSGEGMTADHASDILGTANSSMQRMGGTEASRNFTMQAFGMDPIRSAMRAEGGLFGNGLDNGEIGGYMRLHGVGNWDSLSKGPTGTNFGIMRDSFDKAYAARGQYGAEMELDAEKNYFGLHSYADTASFMKMSDSDHSGIVSVLKNAGLQISDVREGGLQAIAGISKASSFDDLDKLYRNSIRGRGDMSPADIGMLDGSEKGGDFQSFQNELVRVLAGKGQEDTQATTQRSIDATLSDIKTKIGDGLLPMTNTIMTGIIKMAGLSGPSAAATGAGSPYGFGSSGKGLVANPGGLSAAAGGSTIGGAGQRNMSGHVDNSGEAAAAWTNTTYGAMVGGAYSVKQSTVDGMAQLMGMGIDKPHAAAIMASAIRESSMDPGAGSIGSYGLFQFDKSRAVDFQKVMGKSLYGSGQSDQLTYMARSLRAGGEEAGPGSAFWAANGKDAARVFSDKIERPHDKSKEGDIRSGIADSLNNSDIHITLNQTVNGANGSTKVNKISTKVPVPSAFGMSANPVIIEVPPGR